METRRRHLEKSLRAGEFRTPALYTPGADYRRLTEYFVLDCVQTPKFLEIPLPGGSGPEL